MNDRCLELKFDGIQELFSRCLEVAFDYSAYAHCPEQLFSVLVGTIHFLSNPIARQVSPETYFLFVFLFRAVSRMEG